MRKYRIVLLNSFLVVLTLFLLAGCTLINSAATSTTSTTSAAATVTTTSANQPTASAAASSASVVLPSFADLLDVVEHAVVKIDVTVATTDVFGRVASQQGAGSGWIYSNTGKIVTANHVIDGASSITITTLDGKTYPAKVVNGDAVTDLALLQINGSQLPTLSAGDASKSRSGDWVLAIGNPLGEGIIATQGIISRLSVDVPYSATQTYNNMIETTAAINPGNSGGPLINLNGEVIGITTIKVSSSGIEGMGYAININDALPVIQKLSGP